MPGRNGTGPQGRGALTGRGLGPCGSGLGRGSAFAGQGFGGGFGFAGGRGRGRGFGRGMAGGFAAPAADFQGGALSAEEERAALSRAASGLERELADIKSRLSELDQGEGAE